ncbi:MAG TPA: hypothetical protein VFZ34_24930 [Blastocatellia bacterium]|nr:hypothetical protein [Blastocatellia bacterium]
MAAYRLPAQSQKAGSPSLVVKSFYELLRAKRYADGFRLSVYAVAVEGLSADELRELEPDFERIAAALPAEVEIRGEEVSDDKATVFVKLPKEAQPQEVPLIKEGGRWIIGDRETQKLLNKQGREYFFNERMRVSEAEVNEWLQEILGAELIYFKAKQRYTSLDELIQLGGVSKELADHTASGYRFTTVASADGQSFVATAIPLIYGRTGKLSFYADQTNLIRAVDKAGKPATASAAPYTLDKN